MTEGNLEIHASGDRCDDKNILAQLNSKQQRNVHNC